MQDLRCASEIQHFAGRALRLLRSTWRRQKRPLVISIVLVTTFLLLANTPYSLVHSVVHCHCSLRKLADDINHNRSERAREYFTRMNLWNDSGENRDALRYRQDARDIETGVRDSVRKHSTSSLRENPWTVDTDNNRNRSERARRYFTRVDYWNREIRDARRKQDVNHWNNSREIRDALQKKGMNHWNSSRENRDGRHYRQDVKETVTARESVKKYSVSSLRSENPETARDRNTMKDSNNNGSSVKESNPSNSTVKNDSVSFLKRNPESPAEDSVRQHDSISPKGNPLSPKRNPPPSPKRNPPSPKRNPPSPKTNPLLSPKRNPPLSPKRNPLNPTTKELTAAHRDTVSSEQASSKTNKTEKNSRYYSSSNHERGGFKPKRARVAIAIVTVKRRHSRSLGYVIQSAAALHSLLRQQKQGDLFADSFLFVCNVDEKPERHSDAAFLENYIPVIKRYGGSSSPTSSMSDMRVLGTENVSYRSVQHKDVYDKERVDYMFCLQSALRFRPEYVLMVEDDAVALPGMPSVVQQALGRLASKNWQQQQQLRSHPRHAGLPDDGRPLPSDREFGSLPSDGGFGPVPSNRDSGPLPSNRDSGPLPSNSRDRALLPSDSQNRPNASSFQGPRSDRNTAPRQADKTPPAGGGEKLSSAQRSSPQHVPDSGGSGSFAYLKLYFPLNWQGFALEPSRLLDLASMSAVSAPLIACFLRACLLRATDGRTKVPGLFRRLVTVSAVLSVAVCVLLGRQNVNELRRLSEHFYRLQASPNSSTAAVLYPGEVVPDLIRWLGEECEPGAHVDLCIAPFVERAGLPAYSVEPNLFLHIGTVTSLTRGNKGPQEVLFYGAPK